MKRNTKNEIIWAGRDKEERTLLSCLFRIKNSALSGIDPPFKPKELRSCDLIISEKCNLKCRKCFSWKNAEHSGLSFSECKRIVNQISHTAVYPFEINLGGGEPLINPWIFDLIRYCRKKGLSPALTTNASLVDEKTAKKLARSGLARLSVSVDSFNKKTYEYISGVEGSYEKMRKGLELVVKEWRRGMLNIHVLLTGINLKEVGDILEYVKQNDKISGIHFQAAAQPFYTQAEDEWYKKGEFSFLWPQNLEEMHNLLDELIKRRLDGEKINNPVHQLKVYKLYYEKPERFSRKFRCNLGDYNVTINSRAIAHLCPFMEGLCDINVKPLNEMWYSHHASNLRYAMNNCRKSCNNIMNCYFEEENIDAFFSDEINTATLQFEKKDEVPHINFCNLLVTPHCELDCRICKIGREGEKKRKHFKDNSLTTHNWKWIIDELSYLKDESMNLYFSGGEPLLVDGIFDLINFAGEKGFHTMLGTSGSCLNKKMIRKIIKSRLLFLEFSIDSMKAEVHDKLRNRKGLHGQIMRAAEFIRAKKDDINLGVSCVISAYNIQELPEFVKKISDENIFGSIYFQALVQPYDTQPVNKWYEHEFYSDLWPRDKSLVEDIFTDLITKADRGIFKIGNSIEQLKLYQKYYLDPEALSSFSKCGKDDSSIAINWLGYVSYCDSLGPAGSLKDFRLEEILKSEAAHERRAEMKFCNRECNSIGCLNLK